MCPISDGGRYGRFRVGFVVLRWHVVAEGCERGFRNRGGSRWLRSPLACLANHVETGETCHQACETSQKKKAAYVTLHGAEHDDHQ